MRVIDGNPQRLFPPNLGDHAFRNLAKRGYIVAVNPSEESAYGGPGHIGDFYRLRLTLVLSQYRAYCTGHIVPYLVVSYRVVLNAKAPAICPFPLCPVLFRFVELVANLVATVREGFPVTSFQLRTDRSAIVTPDRRPLRGCGNGEVVGNNHGKAPMAWDEVDLEGRTWTMPGSGPRKQKSGHIWRCPLSDRAVAILEALPRREGVVFAGGSLKAPLKLMRRLAGDFEVTVHGSDRSTFSDWAAEEHPTIPEETRKLAVGHWLGDRVDQAYRRGDGLVLRRRLAQLWGDFCSGRTGEKVVEIRRFA